MRYLAYILAVLAGTALSFESAIYGQLGETIGELETSFYNFFMGTLIMGLLWLFFGKGRSFPMRWKHQNGHYLEES